MGAMQGSRAGEESILFFYFFFSFYQSMYRLCLITQLCAALCDPMDCSRPGSSVHVDSPGKSTGVRCHALLQGIFPTQGSNPGLLHCRRILQHLSHQGSPYWRQLLYDIVLVSPVQQSEPAVCIHVSPALFFISFPFRSSQSIELHSMFLFIYFIRSINSVYMLIPVSQFSPNSTHPPWYPHICSLYLHFCFTNKIIYTIFLESTYMH